MTNIYEYRPLPNKYGAAVFIVECAAAGAGPDGLGVYEIVNFIKGDIDVWRSLRNSCKSFAYSWELEQLSQIEEILLRVDDGS